MKKATIYALFIICVGVALGAFAIPLSVKEKYPTSLLTNDYGILNARDIENYTHGLTPRPFTVEGTSGAYIYWQCFPRERIVVTLKDTGLSSDDFGWRDNIADLQIRVTINPDFVNQYNMKKRLTVTDFEKRFNKWRNLMKGEKYICLAGSFMFRERKIEDGKEKEIYQWVFEAMKTKSGCDSYLYNCIETSKKGKK